MVIVKVEPEFGTRVISDDAGHREATRPVTSDENLHVSVQKGPASCPGDRSTQILSTALSDCLRLAHFASVVRMRGYSVPTIVIRERTGSKHWAFQLLEE